MVLTEVGASFNKEIHIFLGIFTSHISLNCPPQTDSDGKIQRGGHELRLK